MKVIFLGAGTFSALSFKSLLKHSKCLNKEIEFEILTNKRNSELEFSSSSQFKVFHGPEKSLNFPFDWSKYSLGIVSSFSLFIPPRVIDQIPLINIHPSLLPKWRGPAPIQFSILEGEKVTGVSIIDLHPKTIDAGSILLQEAFEIPNHSQIYYKELEIHLADLGGSLAAKVLNNFDYFWVNKTEQQTQFPRPRSYKITKLDGIISLKTDSFSVISSKIRALSHQIPIKTLDLIENKQVILEDFILSESKTNKNNCIYYDKAAGAIFFTLVDGGIVGVKTFKIEGKSQIFSAGSFYSNYLKNRI